jgi:hypothetical protein
MNGGNDRFEKVLHKLTKKFDQIFIIISFTLILN